MLIMWEEVTLTGRLEDGREVTLVATVDGGAVIGVRNTGGKALMLNGTLDTHHRLVESFDKGERMQLGFIVTPQRLSEDKELTTEVQEATKDA